MLVRTYSDAGFNHRHKTAVLVWRLGSARPKFRRTRAASAAHAEMAAIVCGIEEFFASDLLGKATHLRVVTDFKSASSHLKNIKRGYRVAPVAAPLISVYRLLCALGIRLSVEFMYRDSPEIQVLDRIARAER